MKKTVFPGLIILFVMSAVLILTAASCRKKTEREEYESATSGLKYRAYKTLSEQLFPPAFQSYNSGVPDSLKVREEYGRLLMAYVWMCSGKTTFGFAESHIVQEQAEEAQFKLLARMLIAIGMYENGWKDLAGEEAEGAIAELDQTPDNGNLKIELTLLELLAGTYCVYSRDFDGARLHFAGFAVLSGVNWPHDLVDAMGDVESGNIQQGLKKIKAMSKDESVPEEVRKTLAEAITKVEASTGDVDSSLFWPRVISSVLYDELGKSAQPGISGFMKLMSDLKEKLSAI